MFAFDDSRPARKPSLTPMIDVVFLLLVFFMLASRFGHDVQLPLNAAGSGDSAAYRGPPRLVDIHPDTLTLNGTSVSLAMLAAELDALTESGDDTIVLRARGETPLQRVVDVMQKMTAAGFTKLVMVE